MKTTLSIVFLSSAIATSWLLPEAQQVTPHRHHQPVVPGVPSIVPVYGVAGSPWQHDLREWTSVRVDASVHHANLYGKTGIAAETLAANRWQILSAPPGVRLLIGPRQEGSRDDPANPASWTLSGAVVLYWPNPTAGIHSISVRHFGNGTFDREYRLFVQ